MGNVPSLKMEVVPADPVTWWLDEVKACGTNSPKSERPVVVCCASEKQLRGVFEEVLPDPSPTKDIVIDTIFPRFADERSNTTDGPTGAGGEFKEIA